MVRLLDALNNNAFADTLAAQLTGGATSGYQRFPHSEYNFEVSAPGGSMAPETFYLNTMTGFNLAERPFVLVVARTAGGTGPQDEHPLGCAPARVRGPRGVHIHGG